MCFSPAASFTAASITATTGCLALRRCSGWREIPLAAVPLVFAVQQAAEGVIWLDLLHPARGASSQFFTNLFLILALAVWPVLVPCAAALVEQADKPRRLQFMLAALGLGVGAYGLFNILQHPYAPRIVGRSICYINQITYPPPVAIVYVLAICPAPLISSHPVLRLFGLTVLVGLVASFSAYYLTFVSVWCFFAAVASILAYAFFRMAPVRAAPAAS